MKYRINALYESHFTFKVCPEVKINEKAENRRFSI
jgi:hypothetical protein